MIKLLLEQQRQLAAQRDSMSDELAAMFDQLQVQIQDNAMPSPPIDNRKKRAAPYQSLSGEGAASPGYRSLSDSDDIVDGFEEVSYRSCSGGEDIAMDGNASFEQAPRAHPIHRRPTCGHLQLALGRATHSQRRDLSLPICLHVQVTYRSLGDIDLSPEDIGLEPGSNDAAAAGPAATAMAVAAAAAADEDENVKTWALARRVEILTQIGRLLQVGAPPSNHLAATRRVALSGAHSHSRHSAGRAVRGALPSPPPVPLACCHTPVFIRCVVSTL